MPKHLRTRLLLLALLTLVALYCAAPSLPLPRPFTHKELNHALKSFIPAGDEIYLQKRVDRQADTVRAVPIMLKQATLMTGEALKTAHVAFNRQFGEPYVTFTLNTRGARLFDRLTQEHTGRQLAMVPGEVDFGLPPWARDLGSETHCGKARQRVSRGIEFAFFMR